LQKDVVANQEDQLFSHHGSNLKPSLLQPVLPIVLETLPTKEQDKLKFILFEVKSGGFDSLQEVCLRL
jgi:hypothetical protein